MSNEIDPRTGLLTLWKQPNTDKLCDIASITAVTITAQGLVTEVTALTSTGDTSSGAVVQFTAQGGTQGEDYLVTITGLDSNGREYEGDGILKVRENVQ